MSRQVYLIQSLNEYGFQVIKLFMLSIKVFKNCFTNIDVGNIRSSIEYIPGPQTINKKYR